MKDGTKASENEMLTSIPVFLLTSITVDLKVSLVAGTALPDTWVRYRPPGLTQPKPRLSISDMKSHSSLAEILGF